MGKPGEVLLPRVQSQDKYLEHIVHVVSLIGIDHVGVSTDDMDFCKEIDSDYGRSSLYPYSTVREGMFATLRKKFSEKEVFMILSDNIRQRYDMISSDK